MLKVKLAEGKDIDDFIETGQIDIGDKYNDICCNGHVWEVTYIFSDASVWGVCQNQNCPVENDSHWRGVSHKDIDEIIDCLLMPFAPS